MAGSRLEFTPQAAGPVIVRGEGIELITSTGDRILDAAGGALVTNIGYGRDEVVDAVAASMRRVGYVVPLWATPERQELADLLSDHWLPTGFERVYFAGGGSEATDTAVRLARLHHVARGDDRRYKVIGRSPSYHGATLAALSIGDHRARRAGLEPLLDEFPKVPWNDADALAGAIEAADPGTVAAFIAEPVIGAAGGALVATPDYWSRIGEICAEYGVLAIADEVMTGFGRTGRRWGSDHDPWEPDIIVSGKGLGGGYVPISLVTAHDRVLAPIFESGRNLMFFTYSGHNASCAGAAAVLRIIEREGLVERAAERGAALRRDLESALAGHSRVAEIRGRGLMLGIELAGASAADVVARALELGMWIYPASSHPSVADAVLVAPPMTVSDAECDRIVDLTRRALDAV